MCYDLPGGSRLSKKFLVGYPILKDFSYLFGAKFTGRKFYRWRHGVETSSLSVDARPHALKLASLTFKNLWEVDL